MAETALDDLILAWQEGDLDAAGLAELDRRLCTDPQAPARMAQWTRQALLLRRTLAREQATAQVSVRRRLLRPRSNRRSRRSAAPLLFGGVLLAAAALVVVVLILQVPPATSAPVAARAEPDVQEPAAPVLAAGTVLTAEQDRQVQLDPTVTLDLAAGSEVVLERLGSDTRLVLREGRVALAVAPRPPGGALGVVAGDAEFTVIGTRFAVALGEGRPVRLEVLEGAVRARSGAHSLSVVAGRSWQPGSGNAGTLDHLPSASDVQTGVVAHSTGFQLEFPRDRAVAGTEGTWHPESAGGLHGALGLGPTVPYGELIGGVSYQVRRLRVPLWEPAQHLHPEQLVEVAIWSDQPHVCELFLSLGQPRDGTYVDNARWRLHHRGGGWETHAILTRDLLWQGDGRIDRELRLLGMMIETFTPELDLRLGQLRLRWP